MKNSTAKWRKSARSSSNGENCVEVAALWRKASHSTANGGDCVEVAILTEAIAARDSKNPDAGYLSLTSSEFSVLLDEIKRGRFDL